MLAPTFLTYSGAANLNSAYNRINNFARFA
jgi:hypothetical protein